MDDAFSLPTNGSAPFIIESWMDMPESRIKSLWQWPHPEFTPLRISISGAAGTGKKDLADALSLELDIPSISGIPKTMKTLGVKLGKSSSIEDEMMFLISQLWEQAEYSEFIAAGSLIDTLAHLHYVVDKSGGAKQKALLRAAANLINRACHENYSVFFYLPLRNKPQTNGVRSVDMAFLREIDTLVKYYLNTFDLDFLPISGTAEHTLTTALSYLEDFDLLDGR